MRDFPGSINLRTMAVLVTGLLLAVVQTSLADDEAAKAQSQQLAGYEHAALTGQGDRANGEKLFRDSRTKCAVCHRVGKDGGIVGPELSQIGGKFDRPHLIESLLEPSRQIVEGFRSSIVVTQSGKILTGVVKKRSEQGLQLLDSEGKSHELSLQEIDEEKLSDVSLMPAGLANSLSQAEFTDLVAYLESLRSGPMKQGAGVSGPILLPDGFTIRTVATGLSGAVAMEATPDGRVLVCEQTGSLRVIRDGKLLTTPMLTVPVQAEWERGLIGVTVHPKFPDEPFVYVCYVTKEPFIHHVISRFRIDGDQAVAGSEQILLSGDDQSLLGGKVPAGHQGGALHFGKDGCLYIALGEQTAELPSQKLDTLQGKLLRIRDDGAIPSDNPLVNRTEKKYQSIWAYGLRNPFTFAIHRSSGEILINDVGGKKEEVNRGVAGANYGWPVIDHGPTDDPRFEGAIHTYPQASISGGDFSSGQSQWPQPFRDKYFFADFVHGWIHVLDPSTADARTTNHAETFAEGLRRPVDLRFDNNHRLYVLLRNAWVIDDKYEGGTSSLVAIEYKQHP